MKQLQNNYTTSEQSKRLLELGVPADSADVMFLGTDRYIVKDADDIYWLQHEIARPCWSLGRLIEIELTCRESKDWLIPRLSIVYGSVSYVEELIRYMECKDNKYNFSNLED